MSVIGYKGFEKGMICRDMQYEVGKTYEVNEAKCCQTGLHYCENPLDVFRHYMIDRDGDFCEW